MVEKRLIDANALYDKVEQKYKVSSGSIHSGYREFLDMICDAPTVDAMEGVRCMDCKHYHASIGWCDKLSFFQTRDGEPCSPSESRDWKTFAENDFCSFGERGTDEKV